MKKVLPIILLSLFLLPLVAFAYVEPQVVICRVLEKIKIIVAAIGFGIAVIMLIWGGIMYMTAGGNDEKSTKARKLIINAIIGIAIIFAATFILSLVAGFLSGSGVSLNPFGTVCDVGI